MFKAFTAKYRSATIAQRNFANCIFTDLRGHGFLPAVKPMRALPKEFSVVNDLLDKMTWFQPDGSETGLLAKNEFRKAVDQNLPQLIEQVKKTDPNDGRLNAALFRDFGYLSAAYLLEPCHLAWRESGNYGEGMSYLPETIAVPFKEVADRLQYNPLLLDYSYCYALNNWRLVNDPEPDNMNYSND